MRSGLNSTTTVSSELALKLWAFRKAIGNAGGREAEGLLEADEVGGISLDQLIRVVVGPPLYGQSQSNKNQPTNQTWQGGEAME